MSNRNPLFPDDTPADNDQPGGYLVGKSKSGRIEPLPSTGNEAADKQAAAELIRKKLDKIYADEPDAEVELEEAEVVKPQSKHQEFMHKLSTSGKSLAEIQTEWHHYYIGLPDAEKHQVWQEFYESNAAASQYHKQSGKPKATAPAINPQPAPQPSASGVVVSKPEPMLLAVHPAPTRDYRGQSAIKRRILDQVSAGGKLTAKHHLQSLLFGVGLGFVVVFIFLFGFFNEFFIAPFIQPSRHASATPLILSSSSISPTATPEVIIPKINVEIPVNYTETSTNEANIENDLESGVVHYPTTSFPGQNGNTAFFGHSSNNIFNPGKYKFAFVLLHTLVPGDTFYLTYNGKVYVYKVISKDIVDPSDVGVLGPVKGQQATATLITCDPPGTSLHRLVVVGQQVSPAVSGNGKSTAQGADASPVNLPGNGPTLWSRFVGWLEFWN